MASMLMFPQINPVAVKLGPLAVHWYGIMYLLGFLAFWWLGKVRAKRPNASVAEAQVGDLLFYSMLGVILGGRVGSVLFYNFSTFLDNPLYLFQIWKGGMSFHGGLLGVVIALWLFQHQHKIGFLRLCDFVAPLVPIGLGLGRIGNFINAELWGRPTNLPWGMVFLNDQTQLARHPSQLYEAVLEGLILFVILWIYSRKSRPTGAVCGLFVLLYGIFRFGVEFVREPDQHLGFIAFNWLTLGQLLTVPMVVVGVITIWLAYRTQPSK